MADKPAMRGDASTDQDANTSTDLDEKLTVLTVRDFSATIMSTTMTAGGRSRGVVTRRPCYTQARMDNTYPFTPTPEPTLPELIKDKCRCSPRCVGSSLLRFLPVVNTLRHYRLNPDFLSDMFCGLSVGFLHLPQGLGFGLLASLQPVHGLYTSFFPVLVYMLFGTSPHISIGTNSVVALLAAGIINQEADAFVTTAKERNATVSDEELIQFKVGIAGTSCFIGGLVLIAMGLLRLGFLTKFMAKSFIGGFSFATAVHITVSQLSKLLHLKLPMRTGPGKLVWTLLDIGRNIRHSNVGDVAVGLVSAAVLLAVIIGVNERYKQRLKVLVPVELIVVVLSTMISHLADFKGRFGIDVVGDIPTGMPSPRVPPLEVIPRIAYQSCVTAVLIFALTISLGKLTARLHDIAIDDNQELVAYGLCQLAGAFFGNFSSSISPARTMMLSAMSPRSTLSGFWSAAFMLVVLLEMGRLFVSLPIAMLAAMIVVAIKNLLLEIRSLKSLWYINKGDFFIWLVTAAVSVFGDLDVGLLAGLVVSMVTVLAYSQLAKGTLLGKAEKEDVITDLDRVGIRPIPGVISFRFESQLHFASAERFKTEMYAKICDPTIKTRKDCYVIEVQTGPEAPESDKDVKTRISGSEDKVGTNSSEQDVRYEMERTVPGKGILRWTDRASRVDTQPGRFLDSVGNADEGDTNDASRSTSFEAAETPEDETGRCHPDADGGKQEEKVRQLQSDSSNNAANVLPIKKTEKPEVRENRCRGNEEAIINSRTGNTHATLIHNICCVHSSNSFPTEDANGCPTRGKGGTSLTLDTHVKENNAINTDSSRRHNANGMTGSTGHTPDSSLTPDIRTRSTNGSFIPDASFYLTSKTTPTPRTHHSNARVIDNNNNNPSSSTNDSPQTQDTRNTANGSTPETNGSTTTQTATQSMTHNSNATANNNNADDCSRTQKTPARASNKSYPAIAFSTSNDCTDCLAASTTISLPSGSVGTRGDPNSSSLTELPIGPHPLSDVSHVIVDCSTMTYIDVTGVDMLHLVITQFSRAGVAILLTDVPQVTLGILRRARFFQHEDTSRLYVSVLDALVAIRESRLLENDGTVKSFGEVLNPE